MQTIIPKTRSLAVQSFEEIRRYAEEMQVALESGDFSPKGPYDKHSYALHHSQVTNAPFNFFVVKRSLVGAKEDEGVVVINPKIIEVDKNSRETHTEGCISFPFRPDKKVSRYMRVKVEYEIPVGEGRDAKLEKRTEWVEGFKARIFQHECQHAEGGHIYK